MFVWWAEGTIITCIFLTLNVSIVDHLMPQFIFSLIDYFLGTL